MAGGEIVRHPQRGWTSRLFGGALCLALTVGMNAHAGLFAGITDIRVTPDRRDQLSIHFESDLPFEYDLRVVDADTVIVKLVNARLSEHLTGPGGRLKISTGGGKGIEPVQTARLALDATSGEESLILEGPGLGSRVLTISGATPIALSRPATPEATQSQDTITLPDFKALTPTAEKPASKAKISLDGPAAPPTGSASGINTGQMKDLLKLGNMNRLGQAGMQTAVEQGMLTPESPQPVARRKDDGASLPPLSQAELPGAEEAFLALLKADEEPDFVPRLSNDPVKPEEQLKTLIGDTREEVVSRHRPYAPEKSPAVRELDPFSEKYDPGAALQKQNPTGPQISAIKSIPYIPGQGRTVEMPGAPANVYAPAPAYPGYPPYYGPPQAVPQNAYIAPGEINESAETATYQQSPLLKPVPRYRGDAPPIQYSVSGSHEVYTLPPGQVEADYNLNTHGDEGINALSFDPATAEESAEAHMYQALSHYRRQNYERALTMVEQAVLMDPQNPNIQAALAEIQIKLDRPKEAVKAYEKALQHAEKPALKEKYLGRYAVALYLKGDRKKATENLEALLKEKDGLAANQYVIHFILGTLYQEMGMLEPAIVRLQEAAKLNPDSPDVQFGLGLTYELSGNVGAAKAHYARALKLKPGARDIAMALERVKG